MENANDVRVVFIIGPPLSGKTTLAKQICARDSRYDFFSPRNWLERALDTPNSMLAQYIDNNYNYQGLDPIVTEAARNHVFQALQMCRNIVIDGFPRTQFQVQHLADVACRQPFVILRITNIDGNAAFVRYMNHRYRATEETDDTDGTDELKMLGVMKERHDVWNRYYQQIENENVVKSNMNNVLCVGDDAANPQFELSVALPTSDQSPAMTMPVVNPPMQRDGVVTEPQRVCLLTYIIELLCSDNDSNPHAVITKNIRFPGCHPISLQHQHFSQVFESKHPYLISRKIDGVRYMMFIHVGFVWMIRRDLTVTRYNNEPLESLTSWEGSLFDVEMLESNKCIVIDCVRSKYRNVSMQPVLHRLHSIFTLVTHVLPALFTGGIEFQQYFHLADLRCAMMLPIDDERRFDGIVFTPQKLPYRYGKDMNAFKWKGAGDNTVDLRYYKQTGRLWVCNSDAVDCEDYGVLENNDISLQDRCILECQLVSRASDGTKIWKAVLCRTDKKDPNTKWVADRIVQSIAENITCNDLISQQCVR